MNETLEKIYLSRPDLSDYVFHFTCGAKARDTLIKILSDGALKDINRKGFICFTEAPILMLPGMFDIFANYPEPMYTPYGIGVHRDALYELGGRPVIYGTDGDKALIHESLHWRFIEYKPREYDFSWLREWRLPQKEYVIKEDDIVVVKTIDDEMDILMDLDDMDIEAEPADGGFEYFYTGEFSRNFKGISMERILNTGLDTKDKLRRVLAKQTAIELIPLGSEWR